MKIVVPNVWKG